MSPSDDQMPDEGGDDLVAAEYVLGVLPAEERQAVTRRLDSEQALARLVDRWEVYFAPMGHAYPETTPPASVKASIDRNLFATATRPHAGVQSGLWGSLAFWRGLTVAALAALALYIAVPFVNPPSTQPPTRLVASLAADGSDVRYLVVYDPAAGDVGLSHVAGDRAAGRDFELWMIEGKNAPVSMGVIQVGNAVHITVDAAARAKLAVGAVLAVSLEPTGGSPTGRPTGPVVAAGDLRDI